MSQATQETAFVPAAEAKTFPCESCGADFEFHIGAQSLKCPYCGFVKAVELAEDAAVAEQDFHAMLAKLAKQRQSNAPCSLGEKEFTCRTCAATVVFEGSVTSMDCAYCGSPVQRGDVHAAADRIPVDGVLPFAVEQKQAQSNLRNWVKSRWFAPTAFRKKGVRGKFNGVYYPHWTFDSMTYTHYRGQRGVYYYVTVGSGDKKRQERRVRWSPVSGSFQRFFDDVLICAGNHIKPKLAAALEPWPLHQCKPFAQSWLAGYSAMTYDQDLENGFQSAKQRMDHSLEEDVRRRIGGDTQRISSMRTRYDAVTYKHLLLPVWLMAYRFHGKTYQVVVNACTGEVRGERPWSIPKILLAVFTGLTVAALITYTVAAG